MTCDALEACSVFRRTSIKIAQWRRAQPNVGEESLTDYLLWKTSSLPCVRYVKFSRHQEARETGADWEWWFVGNSASVGLRMQAKLLHSNPKDNYKGLAHSNQYGYQMEIFIRDAVFQNLFPFYAFYWSSSVPLWMCQGGKGIDEGVFTTSAFHLYDSPLYLKNVFGQNKDKPVTATDILSLSNPLSWFFCCSWVMQPPEFVVEKVYQYVQYYWGDRIREALSRFSDSMGLIDHFGLHTRPPRYIEIMIEKEQIPSWFEDEYRQQIKANAIMVIDARPKKVSE